MFTRDFPSYPNTPDFGLVAGTLVEGPNGWRPVEELRIGDAVQSYDGGLARVLGLDRHWIRANAGAHLVLLAGGALDNCSDLMLLPNQNLLIDTLGDRALPDAIVAMIPAAALEGAFDTKRIRIEQPIEVITPRFADDEAIFANSGTLLHCPAIAQVAGDVTSDFFTQLDIFQAKAFLQRTYRVPAQQPQHRRAA